MNRLFYVLVKLIYFLEMFGIVWIINLIETNLICSELKPSKKLVGILNVG